MSLSRKIVSSLKAGLNAVSPDCRQVSRWQSDAGTPLSPAKRTGLRLHRLLCAWCRRYGKQIRFLRGAVDEPVHDCGEHAPTTLSAERREQMKRSLRDTPK
jgi:hypothetical protein